MDLIFRGNNGVAVNPDYLYIKSFEEDGKVFYSIRACFIDGDNWVRITENFESHEEAIKAYKSIYNEAINLALSFKK